MSVRLLFVLLIIFFGDFLINSHAIENPSLRNNELEEESGILKQTKEAYMSIEDIIIRRG